MYIYFVFFMEITDCDNIHIWLTYLWITKHSFLLTHQNTNTHISCGKSTAEVWQIKYILVDPKPFAIPFSDILGIKRAFFTRTLIYNIYIWWWLRRSTLPLFHNTKKYNHLYIIFLYTHPLGYVKWSEFVRQVGFNDRIRRTFWYTPFAYILESNQQQQ